MSAGEGPIPSFEAVVSWIRKWCHITQEKAITPETQFERDLGITGDDGSELVEAALRHFGIHLAIDGPRSICALFNLKPKEYLFHSEGFGIIFEITTLFGASEVRAFTVGELREAVKKGLSCIAV